MKTRLEEHVVMLLQLARKDIPPSKVVGTGYKNARNVAFEYLAEVIAQEYRQEKEHGKDTSARALR